MRNAVTAAFIAFYEKGLIKRANRMVNWSPALLSAISDLEVDYLELPWRTLLPLASHGGRSYEFGVMVQFAYKVEDSGPFMPFIIFLSFLFSYFRGGNYCGNDPP
jgi:valyl-tRNA synthetase